MGSLGLAAMKLNKYRMREVNLAAFMVHFNARQCKAALNL